MGLVSIVMPALNEEEGIIHTINSVPKTELKKLGYAVEILIVDGESEDNTVKLAEKAGARVISSQKGYGRQIKKGLHFANGDIIIIGDSDGTYPFENIIEYLNYFEKNKLEFITFNRFADMENGAMPLSNRFGNFVLNLVINLLFSLNLKDSQSGMWIIQKKALQKLYVESDDMPFSQEIKIEAFKKLNSIELPGKYKKRLGKTKLLKLRNGFGNLWAIFKKRITINSTPLSSSFLFEE